MKKTRMKYFTYDKIQYLADSLEDPYTLIPEEDSLDDDLLIAS